MDHLMFDDAKTQFKTLIVPISSEEVEAAIAGDGAVQQVLYRRHEFIKMMDVHNMINEAMQ